MLPSSAVLTMPVTAERAQALGLEAGDRSAAQAGRTVWEQPDYMAAIREFIRLTKKGGHPGVKNVNRQTG